MRRNEIAVAAMAVVLAASAWAGDEADQPAEPRAGLELTERTLDEVQTLQPSEQLPLLRERIEKILDQTRGNVLVSEELTDAIKRAKSLPPAKAAAVLRLGLMEASEVLEFEPLREAPLPEDFPEPTPLGEIQVKKYPTYRLARTDMQRREGPAFWTLFKHIKDNDIAMTAPVEMEYAAGGEKMQPRSMAFLYRSVKQGQAGKQGKVQVADAEPRLAVSIGLRGKTTDEQIAQGERWLRQWLKQNPQYQADGDLRVMGYNSPFVPPVRSYFEVELPIKKSAE